MELEMTDVLDKGSGSSAQQSYIEICLPVYYLNMPSSDAFNENPVE
jgi:hypothetical protein